MGRTGGASLFLLSLSSHVFIFLVMLFFFCSLRLNTGWDIFEGAKCLSPKKKEKKVFLYDRMIDVCTQTARLQKTGRLLVCQPVGFIRLRDENKKCQ